MVRFFTYAAAGVLAAASAAPISAQTTPTASVEAVIPEDPGALLEQLLEQIKLSNDAGLATKVALEQELEGAVINVQQADNYFDDIVAKVQERAELGNPEGKFVQNIKALEAEMRATAADALANGDTEYATRFDAEANDYQAAGTLATQYYDGLGFRIDNINALRSKVVYEIKLRRSSQARIIVQRGLNMLAETDNQLAEAETKLRAIFGTTEGEEQ